MFVHSIDHSPHTLVQPDLSQLAAPQFLDAQLEFLMQL